MTSPPATTSLSAALELGLQSTPHLPRDIASIALARTLATLLDDAQDRLTDAAEDQTEDGRDFARMVTVIDRLAPKYAAMLDRLGMSPGARPATRGGELDGRTDPAAGELARLQSAAPGAPADGLDYAEDLHPAVAEAHPLV